VNRLRSALLMLALATLAACGDDSSTNPNEAVAGTYHATRMDVTFVGDTPTDALAFGGSIDIVLTPQGTTTGTLVVPAFLTEDGIDEDVIDLAGTYTITGNTLRFQGQGDSFIPDIDWTIGDGTLSTILIEPEGTFEVILTRS
jgi:hypothetical protein